MLLRKRDTQTGNSKDGYWNRFNKFQQVVETIFLSKSLFQRAKLSCVFEHLSYNL